MQIHFVKRLQGNQFVARVHRTNAVCRFVVPAHDISRIAQLEEGAILNIDRTVFDIQAKLIRIEACCAFETASLRNHTNDFGVRQSLDT